MRGRDVLRLDWVVGGAVIVVDGLGNLGSRVFWSYFQGWVHGRFRVVVRIVLDGGGWKVYSMLKSTCVRACASCARVRVRVQPIGFEDLVLPCPCPGFENRTAVVITTHGASSFQNHSRIGIS